MPSVVASFASKAPLSIIAGADSDHDAQKCAYSGVVVKTASFEAMKDEKIPTALEARCETSQSENHALNEPMFRPLPEESED